MDTSGRSVWFVGDFDDPWVVEIADALPRGVRRVGCPEGWTEGLFQELPDPATLVLHRTLLDAKDAERLARLRKERGGRLWVILCVGPHPRYVDLARWSALVDVVLPEATARETIARHVFQRSVRAGGEGRGSGHRPRIDVISGNHELREALADICRSAGYPTRIAADWAEVEPGAVAVWDVPVLEPGWGRTLGRYARQGGVVTLVGFADRRLVAEARARGAAACLDLPCEPADLIEVLDRLTGVRPDGTHEVPPPPHALRRGQMPVVEPRSESYN